MRQHIRSIHTGTLPDIRYFFNARRCLHATSKQSTRGRRSVASGDAEDEPTQDEPHERVAEQVGNRKGDNIRSYLRRWTPPVGNNLGDAFDKDAHSSKRHHLPRPRSIPEQGHGFDTVLGASRPAFSDELQDRGQDEPSGAEEDLSDFVHYMFSLEPGDLIFMGGEVAVLVCREHYDHTFLMPDGRCVVPPQRYHKSHIIKGFARSDHIAALSAVLVHDPTLKIYLPANGIEAKAPPAQVTGPILSKMQDLQREMDQFNRENPTAMDDIYQSALPDSFHQLTFDDFVQTCMPEQQPLSEAAKLALLISFKADPRFVLLHSARNTAIALVPLNLWNACNRVIQWSRAYQDAAAQAASGNDVTDQLRSNPLTSFIDKARRLILQSRQYRMPTPLSTLGPSNFTLPPDADPSSDEFINEIINEEFSANDKDFISFFWVLYCMRPSFAGRLIQQYRSVGALILRALGAYPKVLLDYKVGRLALQELGCLQPWQDPSMFHVFAPLAALGYNPVVNRLNGDIQALHKNYNSSRATGLFRDDSVQHIRKDWGDLPVYTIDNANVESKDDGISFESSTSRPGSYWIRVHVFDIAARFRKEHPLVQKALLMGSPYFGKVFTEHMADRILAGNCGISPGCAVLTISTLVDPDGSVSDIDITPGKVNNIIDVDRPTLSRNIEQFEIGERVVIDLAKRENKSPSGPAQDDSAIRSRREHVVHEHMPVFIKLSEVLDKRAAARDADLPSSFRFRKPFYFGTLIEVGDVKVNPHYTNIYRSTHYRRDPSIVMTSLKTPAADPLRTGGSLTRGLVGDCAMLAEESAGKWLFDRHIPAVYSGNRFQAGRPQEWWIKEELERRQNPNPDLEPPTENVILPVYTLSTEPSVNLSSSTRYHCPLTSPLRSSIDLAMHYQINAYFRVQNDVSLDKASKASLLQRLPYSKGDLKNLLRHHANPIAEKMSRQATAHWFYLAFQRAFHFKEAELPALWNVRVSRAFSGELRGNLMPFGLSVKFVPSEEKFEENASIDSFLPCTVQLVDAMDTVVWVLATGPASKKPEVEINMPTISEDDERIKLSQRGKLLL